MFPIFANFWIRAISLWQNGSTYHDNGSTKIVLETSKPTQDIILSIIITIIIMMMTTMMVAIMIVLFKVRWSLRVQEYNEEWRRSHKPTT